jgi:ABC-type glycerol-3-phosphate transport system permease component
MQSRRDTILIHLALLFLACLVYVPFVFVINSSFRSNEEMYRSFFGIPDALRAIVLGQTDQYEAATDKLPEEVLVRGYSLSWEVLRRYMLNSVFVSGVSAVLVVMLGSMTAYVLSRYNFIGSKVVFALILSTMMIPGVLTLVPSFLLVRKLNLLNTYWVLILPYVAGGQVFGIFVFRSFFGSLPEDLFESARIDGAGHFSIYFNIVLPLSLPVLSVVAVMNILATWNNFLWPLVTISQDRLHVVSSGLYVMASSQTSANLSTMNAAYVLSSIPLLVLFMYATKPFVRGVTSGAIKA